MSLLGLFHREACFLSHSCIMVVLMRDSLLENMLRYLKTKEKKTPNSKTFLLISLVTAASGDILIY